MDKKGKFQAIKKKTNDLLNVIDQMEFTGIKQIDIDLLRLKFADIYDEILTLTPEKDAVVDIQPEPEFQKEEIITESGKDDEKSVEKKPEVEVVQEAKIKSQEELNLDFKEEEPEVKPEEKEEKPYVPEIDFVRENDSAAEDSKKTIGESFQGKKTLNELITEIRNDKEAGTGLNFLKIDNLSHAISINDKIEFVRELFGNDADKYAETIQKINDQKDLDSAIFELTDLDFDNAKPAAKKFLNLVYRKFLDE